MGGREGRALTDHRARKAPCVDLRTDHVKDERFAVLGDIAGYNRYEAVGRLVALWSWCVDRGLKDAPAEDDGYVVSEHVVCRFLGPEGVRALLGGGVDDFALGAVRADGRIYLRGTSEYVAVRRRLARAAQAGGVARAADSHNRGRESGRFVSRQTTHQPSASHKGQLPPAVHQPEPAPSPSPSPSPSSSGTYADLDQVPPGKLVASARVRARANKQGTGRDVELPAGWEPKRSEATQQVEREAADAGVDVRRELANMRDWALEGFTSRDWDSRWRRWLRTAMDIAAGRTKRAQRAGKPSDALAAVQRIADGMEP
jgi:hypothetical protein